jgi:hypothetical protein
MLLLLIIIYLYLCLDMYMKIYINLVVFQIITLKMDIIPFLHY